MSFQAIRYPLILVKNFHVPFQKVLMVRRHYMLDRPHEDVCVVANYIRYKPDYLHHNNFTKLLLTPYTNENKTLLMNMYDEYCYLSRLLNRHDEFLYVNKAHAQFGHVITLITPFTNNDSFQMAC